MGSIIFCLLFLVVAFGVGKFVPVPAAFKKAKGFGVAIVAVLGVVIGVSGAVRYNDAGFCTFYQNIAGSENATCKTGWYVEGWGSSVPWPHYITVSHTVAEDAAGSSVNPPYLVRMADNWTGHITQITRFAIPQDKEQFMKMHKAFRSPERLIGTTLKPAITSSLDSVANLYSMEEYYAGGMRDQFKTEFQNAVLKGRPRVKQVINHVNTMGSVGGQTSSDVAGAQDTSEVGETDSRRVFMEKVLDKAGNPIIEEHAFVNFGIIPSTPILENLDPDDAFEIQIKARKDAASRRIVAQEERREQEEQRLLAIQTGETNIAKKQADAKVEQIEKTTNAETKKQLALIDASQLLEQAEISKQTSAINLEKAKIDAEARVVAADAEAYEKKALLEADNALAQKLKAEVDIQTIWAKAYASRKVPEIDMRSGAGTDNSESAGGSEVSSFMQLMTVQAARQLNYDRSVEAGK